MAGKTKATTKGSPVEIKEIKRITNYAMSVAGGQGYQPGGRFLVAFNRRGYFSTKASRANRVGLVSGSGLSNNLLCRCAFSRCRSSMDNAISCSSSFVIVCTRKAVRCSTSYHSAGIFYGCNLRDDSGCFATHCININNVMLLCAFKENAGIFRTNFSRNTSDHLSKKAAYTEAIPYKTGIGRENPFNCKAINDARSVFFSASALRHINGVVYCAYSCTIQSFHELHFAQRHQQTMVMLAGLPKGRPESLQSGFLTPASVTALCERENSCGDVIHHCKEAANMATIPALVHSQTVFIWRFIIFGASESQIIHVTAWTEREARNRCPSGCVAVFAARIRQEASHG
ncbi:host cell division inhibitor Icd-like protein [Escherichia coli]|nr:ash family protein [Escherichia coli]EFK9557544.1 ash family protein [Escherichia coli]EGY0628344.1 ash family protein [Escherichia coli]EIU0232908.1 host cell division inhibitor Icd-like protein [Escherichia coli]ELT2206911.1 host cell division inhibitor Icd-like protein [Escherichia coli]